MNMLLFKKIMKRHKLALISILVVLGVVLLVAIVDIPFFMDKISRGSSSLRENIISIAKVAIPLKDRILSRTVVDKLARIHSTGACQFCDLTQANMEGMDLKGIDLRYANLARANLYGTNLTGANLRGANLSRVLLRNAVISSEPDPLYGRGHARNQRWLPGNGAGTPGCASLVATGSNFLPRVHGPLRDLVRRTGVYRFSSLG